MLRKLLSIIAVLFLSYSPFVCSGEWAPEGQWAKGKKIRFFVGGDAGDTFASIVYKGALQAEKDLGATVDYVFSGWSVEKMTQQFREAIAARPDGIVMMGIAGDKALMPLAKQARDAGIGLMWQTADVPELRSRLGGGYIGVLDLYAQGWNLAKKAIDTLDLDKNGTVIILGPWGQPGRLLREGAVADCFEKHGYKVVRIKNEDNWASDPNLATPTVSAALLTNPDAVCLVVPGGQLLGATPAYLSAASKKPGEVKAIGFDISPEIIRGFKRGYVQLASDQQPFLHGYLSVVSLCLQSTYDLAPLVVDTGSSFVTVDNYKMVEALALQGLR